MKVGLIRCMQTEDVIGFISCRGADTIALASCITKGNPIGFACPHAEQMIAAIRGKIGEEITIIDYTH